MEKGSYNHLLNRPGGYVQQLGIKAKQIDEHETQSHDNGGISELPEAVTSTSNAPASMENRKQMTDLDVYKYYFSAMGWWRVAVLLFFLVVNGGVGGFRCTRTSSILNLIMAL